MHVHLHSNHSFNKYVKKMNAARVMQCWWLKTHKKPFDFRGVGNKRETRYKRREMILTLWRAMQYPSVYKYAHDLVVRCSVRDRRKLLASYGVKECSSSETKSTLIKEIISKKVQNLVPGWRYSLKHFESIGNGCNILYHSHLFKANKSRGEEEIYLRHYRLLVKFQNQFTARHFASITISQYIRLFVNRKQMKKVIKIVSYVL
jgi:hypothetical protein